MRVYAHITSVMCVLCVCVYILRFNEMVCRREPQSVSTCRASRSRWSLLTCIHAAHRTRGALRLCIYVSIYILHTYAMRLGPNTHAKAAVRANAMPCCVFTHTHTHTDSDILSRCTQNTHFVITLICILYTNTTANASLH